MSEINLQTNLEIKDGKLRITHYEYEMMFLRRKRVTSMLFEDISNLSVTKSYLKWVFWGLAIICFLGVFQTCSSGSFSLMSPPRGSYNDNYNPGSYGMTAPPRGSYNNNYDQSDNGINTLFILFLGVLFILMGSRQSETTIRIETRGGNHINFVPEGDPLDLIEKIEEVKESSFRSNSNATI
jgi:hypothetical protein